MKCISHHLLQCGQCKTLVLLLALLLKTSPCPSLWLDCPLPITLMFIMINTLFIFNVRGWHRGGGVLVILNLFEFVRVWWFVRAGYVHVCYANMSFAASIFGLN